jgi:hypothetical protein
LAGSDQFTITRTAALLYTLVTKKVAVPRRATHEFTSSCYFETFGDGFTCFLHEKFGKDGENIAFASACKGLKREIENDINQINSNNGSHTANIPQVAK